MNFFDHVSRWPPVTPELELLIQLKYGSPRNSPEYVNSLPDAVVEMAYNKIMARSTTSPRMITLEVKRGVLGLTIKVGDISAQDTIKESLYQYHTLVS